MRWTVEGLDEHVNARTRKLFVRCGGISASYASVVHAWRHDANARAALLKALEEAPFAAYFWETPPVTEATAEQRFEFVLVDSPGLARFRPDSSAFAEHLGSGDEVVAFSNLGRDAQLVVPCPQSGSNGYAHLAAFVREAPESQRHELWRRVGAAMERRIGAKPVWLSTAGLGVPWVHVRLDDRPKYYTFEPYRTGAA